MAGLSVGGLPTFVGDLLLSWRFAESVELPTQRTAGVYPGLNGDHAIGLAQKLVIVRPYLMVIWAGSQARALEIICALDKFLPLTVADLPNVALIFSILRTCGDGVELVVMVTWPDRLEPYCIGTRGFELDEKRIYLLGSGGPAFFDYLTEHPPVKEDFADKDMLARSVVLRFAAHSFSQQWTSARGLADSWGGGFEIAYAEQDGFHKIDNLLIRAWVAFDDGTYDALCESFFVKYYGSDLFISWFRHDEKTYIVRSPIGLPATPPQEEFVAPVWTVDTFLFRSTGQIIDAARFHPRKGGIRDTMHLIEGRLVGWSMDQNYVDERLQQALNSSPRSSQFTANRY